MRDLPNFKQVKKRNSKSTPKQKRKRKLRTATYIKGNLTDLKKTRDRKKEEKERRSWKQKTSKKRLLVA